MAGSALYQTPLQNIMEIVKVIAAAVIIMFIIRSFIIEPFYIPSGSMLNTLQPGDRVFVNKFSYGIHLPFMPRAVVSTGKPARGDIVVFPFPQNPKVDYIKRVVGLPGDVLEVRDKQFYRNGEAVNESYVIHSDPRTLSDRRDFMPPVTVPEGKIFVMGDNRDASLDSRFWAFVDLDTVYGKAFIIYWSGNNFININWERIGNLL
jgi:signal peptidase I